MLHAAAAILLCSQSGLTRLHHPAIVPDGWSATRDAVDLSEQIPIVVGVKRANPEALTALADRVSDPRSAGYLRHATHEEMGDLVRPPAARVAAVTEWLRAHNAVAVSVHAHGDTVMATMALRDIERLASGSFEAYRHVATGRVLVRMTSGVWVPAEVADAADTVTGFHGFPLPPPVERLGASAGAGKVNPSVINKIHNIPSAVPKSGQGNIQAIAQFQGQYVKDSDLASFCQKYEPSGKSCKIAKYIGKNQQKAGVESMLDTEYIMGVGQGTETWVYSYPSMDFCSDLLTFGSDVSANSTFPYSISISYGSQKIDFCEASVITRLSQDMQKLAGMGVTVMISSGDDGSGHSSRQGTNAGKLSPSFPASIPYVIAVGSTYFVSGTSGEEEATTQFGSGGGFSYDYQAPDFQKDAVAAYLADASVQPKSGYAYAKNGRATPDVSLLGEQFTVIANGREEAVGGTSASSPSYAAIVSLLNEVCLKAGGRPLGFAAPLFYQNAAAFTDITKGTSAIGSNKATGAWKATKGWDAATGLGIPDFVKLQTAVQKACAAGPAPQPPVPVMRYHCNTNTHQCAEQSSGHSTLAKCQAACQ